jgi:hypothetical protein
VSRLYRAEIGGRTFTYVAGDVDQLDAVPRVYVQSRTSFEDGDADQPLASRFFTSPVLTVGDNLAMTPAGARELAERLLVAAVQAEIRCGCSHEFWLHWDGRPCMGRDEETSEACRCSGFDPAIQRSKVA